MGTAGGVSRFSTQPKGASAMANPTHTPGKAGQGMQDSGKGMVDKAGDMASAAADKPRDMASDAAGKARELASPAGDRAENPTQRAGSSIESLGHAVREKMPHSGTMGAVADRAAGGLES